MLTGWPEIPRAAAGGKEGTQVRGAMAAPGPSLHKGCNGAATQEKALPWSPSNHKRLEQHVAGRD